MEADQDVIVKAVKLLSRVFRENSIPELEGGIAMLMMLNLLKEKGFDIRAEPALQS